VGVGSAGAGARSDAAAKPEAARRKISTDFFDWIDSRAGRREEGKSDSCECQAFKIAFPPDTSRASIPASRALAVDEACARTKFGDQRPA
jgi:hypothetical protein